MLWVLQNLYFHSLINSFLHRGSLHCLYFDNSFPLNSLLSLLYAEISLAALVVFDLSKSRKLSNLNKSLLLS